MTAQQRAALDQVLTGVIGGIATVVALILVAIITGAWSIKENVADHKADIQAVRADIRRVLDVVCLDKPSAPQCK